MILWPYGLERSISTTISVSVTTYGVHDGRIGVCAGFYLEDSPVVPVTNFIPAILPSWFTITAVPNSNLGVSGVV